MEEVREYERTMQEETNCKVKSSQNAGEAAKSLKKQQQKRKQTLLIMRAIPKSQSIWCYPPPLLPQPPPF